MRIIATVLLFQSFLIAGYCQNGSEIKVIDAITNAALQNAKVALFCPTCPDGKSKHLFTNEQGLVNVPNDKLQGAKISFTGYETVVLKDNVQSYTVALIPSYVALDDVVVTAQYKPENPEKVVHSVKIIDRKKIESLGAVNLRDVLKNESNIRISQDNILGSSTSIQGLSGQNVKILIDGVPVIGRLGGNIDLSQINLNDIERIEIIEGPLSVEYGTNALAGTINLITNTKAPKEPSADINTYWETVGQYNVDGRFNHPMKNGNINISAGRNFFDGWSPTDNFLEVPREQIADFNRTSQWKPKEQLFGRIQLTKKINLLNVNLSTRIFNENILDRGLPRSPYFESAFDQEYTTHRLDNSLNLNGQLNPNARLNMLFSYNNYSRRKNTYFKDLVSLESNLSNNASDQDTTIANLFLARGSYSTTKTNSTINYSIGYDINVEQGKGNRIEDNKKRIGDYAMFTSLEYQPNQSLTIRPGIRYSYNTANKAPITPSNIQGNPDLLAERSDNFNLSLSHAAINGSQVTKVKGSLFYNDIKNLITLADGGDNAFTYFNVDRFKTVGFQVNASHRMEQLLISLGGSYAGSNNNLPDEIDNRKFYFSPEVRSSIEYELTKSNVRLALFYKYTGQVTGFVYIDDSDLQEIFLDDYHNMDITATKPFLNNRLNLTLGLKNLFDVKDIQASTGSRVHTADSGTSPLGWGRSVFTAINFKINQR